MLAGYITYEELKLITGYTDTFLQKLITKGLRMREADLEYDNRPLVNKNIFKQTLFDINEVEEWLKVYVF